MEKDKEKAREMEVIIFIMGLILGSILNDLINNH